MQGKQITIEDIQLEKLLHAKIVEKCDLITSLWLKNEEMQKELNSLKETKKDEEK